MVGGVVDDDQTLLGSKIVGIEIQAPESIPDSAPMAIAIGNNKVRHRFVQSLETKPQRRQWAKVVHPSAIIDPTVTIGEGTVVMAGAIIQAGTKIGKHAIINTKASVDHDVSVGDFCHICPGATIAGHVSIGQFAMVGAGANVIPCMTIQKAAIVGAGACVISDVAENCIVVGVPAKSKSQ